jgi:hypothetical protein
MRQMNTSTFITSKIQQTCLNFIGCLENVGFQIFSGFSSEVQWNCK